jgi:antiphage defense system Thoeris ThsB-like protein
LHPLMIVLGGLGSIVAADKLIDLIFAKKKIFISYYYDKDKTLKRLLNAWSKNDKFEIEFEDMSADVSLDTKTDKGLGKELTRRIKKSDIVLVLVGNKTYSRKWVKYEIKEAVRLSKPIVAVKQSRDHISPAELKGVGANWVYGFRAQKVSDALKDCF